jgi:hypothetical protein
MKTQILIIGLAALFTAGCASNGIAPMGSNTYMINRGGWPHMNGFAVESECYRDANQFCTKQGLIMVPVSATTIDGQVFANNASCKLIFRAVTSTNDPAYKAYQNGKLTATYYIQPQNQNAGQNIAILQQYQAAQRQQQLDNQNTLRQAQVDADRRASDWSQFLINNKPVIQQHDSSGFPNMQQNKSLPTVLDMPGSSDIPTGKTKSGPDGRIWQEYRTISGYTYWRLLFQ